MSPSLGKSYIRSFDQGTKGKPRVKKETTNQEGSTDFGRSLPFSEQTGSGPQAASRNKEGGVQRDNRPARHSISTTLREQIFKRDHYQCCNCEAFPLTDRKVRLEVDHIVPVSRGGTNDPNNLQTLCHKCNQLKRASLW